MDVECGGILDSAGSLCVCTCALLLCELSRQHKLPTLFAACVQCAQREYPELDCTHYCVHLTVHHTVLYTVHTVLHPTEERERK